eukprot:TRINITY_DN14145_c0_g1_i2.p2 TRINITY_DN14145_c0_g1~~TRINITY_DN14145_c0_g1_i2.p2  ORF type:complete len:101 (+),score=22.02 TRINITY_DN14145_c0_g1_i2:110-412(+)
MAGRSEGGPIYSQIVEKLKEGVLPVRLVVKDESHLHPPRYGRDGETHFRVEVVSRIFDNMSLVERHHRVYAILGDVMDKVEILFRLKTPLEFSKESAPYH